MKEIFLKKEGKKEVELFTNENETEVLKKLTYYLWAKQINNMKHLKFKYNYNYTDKQTLDIIDNSLDTVYIIRITDIPTTMGILDTNKILKGGE